MIPVAVAAHCQRARGVDISAMAIREKVGGTKGVFALRAYQPSSCRVYQPPPFRTRAAIRSRGAQHRVRVAGGWTHLGHAIMSAAVQLHDDHFPAAFLKEAA
jgi:hypothetical protein